MRGRRRVRIRARTPRATAAWQALLRRQRPPRAMRRGSRRRRERGAPGARGARRRRGAPRWRSRGVGRQLRARCPRSRAPHGWSRGHPPQGRPRSRADVAVARARASASPRKRACCLPSRWAKGNAGAASTASVDECGEFVGVHPQTQARLHQEQGFVCVVADRVGQADQ